MKKKFLLLLVICIFSFNSVAFAAEQQNIDYAAKYKEYEILQSKGILGRDVSFDYWIKLKNTAVELEYKLENSKEFIKVYDSSDLSLNTTSSFSMKPGDILITNATISSGITGHAAMAVTAVQILHIEGPGKTPSTLGLEAWHTKYTNKSSSSWTKIYRHSDSNIASEAAGWERANYRNSNAEYVINMDLTSVDKTYCSKMVWQAYYYGPSELVATGSTKRIVLPYNLPNEINDVGLVETF